MLYTFKPLSREGSMILRVVQLGSWIVFVFNIFVGFTYIKRFYFGVASATSEKRDVPMHHSPGIK